MKDFSSGLCVQYLHRSLTRGRHQQLQQTNKQWAGYEISCLPKPNRNTYDKICHQQIKQTLQNYHYIGSTS